MGEIVKLVAGTTAKLHYLTNQGLGHLPNTSVPRRVSMGSGSVGKGM